MADAIKPTLTIAALQKEAVPEAFTFGVNSKIISFPDPMELDFEQTDEFIADLRSGKTSKEILSRWLSDEDYQVLVSAKITGRQVSSLLKAVLEHYELIAGSQGEENTSGTA